MGAPAIGVNGKLGRRTTNLRLSPPNLVKGMKGLVWRALEECASKLLIRPSLQTESDALTLTTNTLHKQTHRVKKKDRLAHF